MTFTTPFGNFAAICRMIKIEHSVFALPFAYAGAFLAAGGWPSWRVMLPLTVAMVAIRSVAMAFNRIADLRFDSVNPRTLRRPLVTGEISVAQTKAFCWVMSALFVVMCALLNPLCLQLSVPALLVAVMYSYLKRFTWLCHFWLGGTLGLAPLAGWISVTASFAMTPFLFFWGVLFWVAGFDIFYSCQDVAFDRSQGLRSVPACFGLEGALHIAAFSHANTAIFFLLAGVSAGLSVWWYGVWALVSVILAWEHKCMKPDDLSKVNMAFFTLNGVVSIVVFVGVLLGIYM